MPLLHCLRQMEGCAAHLLHVAQKGCPLLHHVAVIPSVTPGTASPQLLMLLQAPAAVLMLMEAPLPLAH
jgi:hypothetical protein